VTRIAGISIAIGLALALAPRASVTARAQSSAFHLVTNWAHLPQGFAWGQLADADIDADGNLWVLHRPPTPGGTAWKEGHEGGGEVPVLMFDRSRKLVKSFGSGMFLQPHGLYIDPEGNVWVADSGPFYEAGKVEGKGFQVFKFNRDGKLLLTLGRQASARPVLTPSSRRPTSW
jgi:streptogramin lyase